jgi:molybdate/tungstate transport system ATP-binding protein
MIKIESLSTRLSGFNLREVSVHVEKGEFFVLMGPTGAGKTVLLEALAGLIPIKSGSIVIGGKDVTVLPPENRGISIVYQDYALFPHLTVIDNITYGLHFHKIDKKEAGVRLERLIYELDLSHLKGRLPINLSGGELQRVALARALMVNPKVLLLDEPLSALDPNFREEIRHELKRLHRSSGATFMMVTHDFAEALSLADRGAVIHDGEILQAGRIEDIFQRPNTAFVADFVGMKNIFKSEFMGTRAKVGEKLTIEMGRNPANAHGFVAVRPEDIVLSKKPVDSSMRNSFKGTVSKVLDQGFYYDVHVLAGDVVFRSLITKAALIDLHIQEGLEVFVSFKSTAIHNF